MPCRFTTVASVTDGVEETSEVSFAEILAEWPLPPECNAKAKKCKEVDRDTGATQEIMADKDGNVRVICRSKTPAI